MKPILPLALTLLFPMSLCFAEKAAELKPTISKPGKLLAEENFDSAALGKAWKVAKGDWQVVEGGLMGKEKKADNHAGVAFLAQPIHNAIAKFSFKLDGGESFSLSLNSPKGHLFRASITPTSISLSKDRDKKDEASKTESLGKAEAKFEAGHWYTLMLEMLNDKVALQVDNGVKLTAGNPELDVGKTGLRFVIKGESVAVDDIKLWGAE